MENTGNRVNDHLFAYKAGFYFSLITAVVTFVTFAIAIGTPPLSGPFCMGDCFEYPYTGIAERFPRDYYWMYGAIVLLFSYLAMIVTVHQTTAPEKKIFSMLATLLATMASVILLVDYFVQLSVIQPSLLAGETDGIALLSQFNPHGLFIALEEIGFLLITTSFFVLTPAFTGSKALQWTASISFLFAIISLLLITFQYGIQREYRFEVLIISIAWLEMIAISILLAVKFKKSSVL